MRLEGDKLMNMMLNQVHARQRKAETDRRSISDGQRYSIASVAIPGVRMLAIDHASAGDCVDRIGYISAIIAQLETARAELREIVVGHAVATGARKVKGKTFAASVALDPAARVSLDTAAIRKDMGDDWCAPYERTAVIAPYIARVGAL